MMRHPVVIALGLVAGACIASASLAAPIDVPASLNSIATASAATVVLVPPMSVYRNALDQNGLQSQGCHYTTSDPAAIRQLVALVQAAEVTVNAVYQRPDLRGGVYFRLPDGSNVNVFVADNSGGRLPVLGVAESTNGGQIQSASVSVRGSFTLAMREWAKQRVGTSSGSACERQTAVAEDPKAPPAIPATSGAPASPVIPR